MEAKPSPKKALLTKEQFTALLAAATDSVTKNSALLRFLVLTGAREQETLEVRWVDVDIGRETVTIGAGGTSKNHKERSVDFSPELASLLKEMIATRSSDSSWLFPSPQRGSKDSLHKHCVNRCFWCESGLACSKSAFTTCDISSPASA